jgi:hypothetical protein
LIEKLGENLNRSLMDLNGYCEVFQVDVVLGVCAMDELFRLAFVSFGTFAILAYLVYVACTEGTFNRRR